LLPVSQYPKVRQVVAGDLVQLGRADQAGDLVQLGRADPAGDLVQLGRAD
jgi:hypothetical protein